MNPTGVDLVLEQRGTPGGDALTDVGAINSDATQCRECRPDEVTAAGVGSPDDFQEIFDRYSRPVMSFLRDLLADWTLAEEMTQETFIRAYRSRGLKRPDSRISTWLFGIAFNVAREAIRARCRRRTAANLEDPACRDLQDGGRAADQTLVDKETRRIIQQALSQLSEAQRVVFILKVVNQMRYQEITAITGAGIGKLKTDLHRARLEMRKTLEPYLGRGFSGMRGDS